MHQVMKTAAAHLKDKWDTGLIGTTEAAELLKMNPNTLKTRVSRNQALVLRDSDGRQRASLTFTGYHLIYNLIQDRLISYNCSTESPEGDQIPHIYATWAKDNVLSGRMLRDAIIQITKDDEGNDMVFLFEDGKADRLDGQTALIIPIGVIVLGIAGTLFMRSGHPDALSALMSPETS